ncbi:anti-sigma factor family protein [Thalassotalea piscium]
MLMIKRLMTQYLPGMITCEEVDNFLYDFHEGNLSYVERLKFKLHLSMCSECRTFLNDYIQTIELSKAGFEQAKPSESIPDELVKVILKSRKES